MLRRNVTKLEIALPENFASKSRGATPTGDGTRLLDLIDDNEATNWEWVGTTSAAGKSVTVALGAKRAIKYVQASAFLIPASPAQNRLTALRSFELWTCNSSAGTDCSDPAKFTKAYSSPADAFPSDAPRPTGPSLAMRRFSLPATVYATHVRFVAVANQCLGQPQFQGVQDADPTAQEDCVLGSDQDLRVRISEVQAFTAFGGVGAPGDPVVALGMTGPATAAPGGAADYQITYSNAGPQPSQGAKITTTLPAQLQFVSADAGGVYNASTRTVTWNLGTVPVTFTGVRTLKTKVAPGTALGTVIALQASFTGQLTVSPPTAIALTTVVR